MDRSTASRAIRKVFASYAASRPRDTRFLKTLTDGKLYELYVLALVVSELAGRGFRLAFKGSVSQPSVLAFKAGPGMIKSTDSHFEVSAPGTTSPDYGLYVDIEFEGLGSTHGPVKDASLRHELDIALVTSTSGYPSHIEIVFAVECKAVANFTKSIVKEALGVRREMCLLGPARPSLLTTAGGSPHVDTPSDPPSEYWLAFIDGKGRNYKDSPAAFGIELKHLEP